jgi:hypothetical protein
MQAGPAKLQPGYSVVQGMNEGEAYLGILTGSQNDCVGTGKETAGPSTALLLNNRLSEPSGDKRHALVVRQISRFLKPCPLDGCPMFADFRVRGLNKMGDPDFLYAAPDMTACAAFRKESRMKFANATKLHRKCGGPEFPVRCTGYDRGCGFQ